MKLKSTKENKTFLREDDDSFYWSRIKGDDVLGLEAADIFE